MLNLHKESFLHLTERRSRAANAFGELSRAIFKVAWRQSESSRVLRNSTPGTVAHVIRRGDRHVSAAALLGGQFSRAGIWRP